MEVEKGSLIEGRPKPIRAGAGKGRKDGAPAANPIYLARRLGEPLPRRVEAVIEMLTRLKRGSGENFR